MHKLAAIIILYNPQNLGEGVLLENIHSYSEYIDKFYFIDNSNNDNSLILKDFNSSYIYKLNKNNGGIGGAQNSGCKLALEDGFEWCVTMDQDSFFEPNIFEKYIKLVKTYIFKDTNLVSFGTTIKNMNNYTHYSDLPKKYIFRPLKRKLIKQKTCVKPEIEYVNFTIASGNIINLNTWKELNGFNEYLFIDEVDCDFCHRIIANGKKIALFPGIVMNQHFGEKIHFSLLKKLRPVYSDFRYYYVFRNKLVMRLLYPENSKSYNRSLRHFFIDYCINTIHPIKHWKVFISAIKDYLKYKKELQTGKNF